MKRRILATLLLISVLIAKYYLSPCPGLPRSFFTSPISISSSRIGDMEIETDSFWTKAVVWVNCYCSLPDLTGMRISLPSRLSRYHGFDTVRIPDGDGGSFTLLLGGGDLCDGISVIDPSSDPYGVPPTYLFLPGLAESSSYYNHGIIEAQFEAEKAGEMIYEYGDGGVLVLP